MHQHAAFGGSDAGFGEQPTPLRRARVAEGNRLVSLAPRDGDGRLFLRWCAALDVLVPEKFPDEHPEVKRSIACIAKRFPEIQNKRF